MGICYKRTGCECEEEMEMERVSGAAAVKVMKCSATGRPWPEKPDLEAAEEVAEAGLLLPGLPQHLALECLSQVPMASLWGVSKGWNGLLSSRFFQSLRTQQGAANPSWLYCMVRVTDWDKEESNSPPAVPSKTRFYWLAYDPLPGAWYRLPEMPEEVDFQLSSPGLIGVSYSVQTQCTRDKLFVVAGLKGGSGDQLEPALDAPFVFDMKNNVWSKGSPFRVPRKWCACGVADGKLFVASGCGREWDESVSKSVEVYDPEDDLWETVSEMSTSKMSGEAMTAVNLGGKLHMSSGNGIFLKAGLVFNPATRDWSSMGPALKQGWRTNTVAVDDRFFSLDDIAGKLEVFQAVEDRWKTFLEDSRLQRMKHLTSCMGKLCGSVTLEGGGCVLRIVDLLASPPTFLDVAVPLGEVVAVQVADAVLATGMSEH